MKPDKKVIKYLKGYLGEQYSPEGFVKGGILGALFPESKKLGVTLESFRFAKGDELGYYFSPLNSKTALSVKIAIEPRYVVSMGKSYAVDGSFVLNIFPKWLEYEGFFRDVGISVEVAIPFGKEVNKFSQAFFNTAPEESDNRLTFYPIHGLLDEVEVTNNLINMITAIQLLAPQEGGSLWDRIVNEGKTPLLEKGLIKKMDDLEVFGIKVGSYTPSFLELNVSYRGAISSDFGNVFPLNGAYCKPENLTAKVRIIRPPLQPENKLPKYTVHPPNIFRGNILVKDLTPQ